MTFLKNKPFHFLLAFIFICMATKTISASPTETPKLLSKENNKVILGDTDSLFLEKKEGDKWRLIECKSSSYCKEARMSYILDNEMDYYIKELQPHIENYCQQEKEDALCAIPILSRGLAQRKIDRDEALAWTVNQLSYESIFFAPVMMPVVLVTAMIGAGTFAGAAIVDAFIGNEIGSIGREIGTAAMEEYMDFVLGQKHIDIKNRLRKIVKANVRRETRTRASFINRKAD